MQRIRSVHIGGIVGISAAMMLLALGCQDIIPFPEVTGTETSSSSSSSASGSSSSGAGGMGSSSSSSSTSSGNPSGCVSNTDCTTPSPICDVPKGNCVECLEAADCSLKPGTVCSAGSCACPTLGDSYCRMPDRCVDLQVDSADCGTCDHPCFGACVAGKCADAWEPTPTKQAPTARANHVAVWTGGKMIVWGGEVAGGGNTNTGGMFDLAGYRWDSTSTANAPSPRKNARAVWTGTAMVVWGGENGGALNTGGIFNPATNTWTAMSTVNAPSSRYGHTVVWTGTKVLIWGGTDGINYFGNGGAYDPGTETWEEIPAVVLPSARYDHSAVWTGTDMVVFGGDGFNGIGFGILGDGAEYDPALAAWVTAKDGQPPPRARHGSAWTGTEMIIWGGQDANGLSMTGARYVPKNAWTIITSDGAPELRQYHTHVWIAPRLIIWGGQKAILPNAGTPLMPLDTGSLYDPVTNTWSKKPIPSGPAARTRHSSVNASGKLIVFGGFTTGDVLTRTGGILDPSAL